MHKSVSVITACYNIIDGGRESSFRRCVESIATQDYPHIEHIIVDGASTDGSLALFHSLKSENTRIFSEPDTGIYNAYNKGIAHAQGDYIAFINSDDYYCAPNAVRLLVEALETNSGVGYAYGATLSVKPDGSIRKFQPNIARGLRSMPINHQSMLYTRDYFDRFGLYDENYRIVADFALYLRSYLAGVCGVRIPDFIAAYGLEGLSSTHKNKANEELAQVLYEQYQPILNCSLEHCQEIIKNSYFATDDIKKILHHAKEKDVTKYLWYNYKYMGKGLIKSIFKKGR